MGLFAGDPDQMEAVMHFIGSDRIKSAIESLPQEDFQQLRVWFAEKDWLLWDKQLEADVADGKLDFLLEEAMAAKSQGTLQDL